jgi:hypothetical protein
VPEPAHVVDSRVWCWKDQMFSADAGFRHVFRSPSLVFPYRIADNFPILVFYLCRTIINHGKSSRIVGTCR